ncbi:hypothetical protein [Streptomyces sp. NBRC 109706]|uniref:hypothetical protein n=1 Tax=Streptomyces sp. NBRC 109706 TaxID=1550035 RepID=UPI00131AEA1C|nr:hypothetical protein [Streptomyces sp. NBRC 109706]
MTSNSGWRMVCGAVAVALLVALGFLVRDAEAAGRERPPAGDRGGALGAPPDRLGAWRY